MGCHRRSIEWRKRIRWRKTTYMGDRQGKENGFCFCGHAGLFHNGLHDLFLLCGLCDDKDHFFFSSECNTKEL